MHFRTKLSTSWIAEPKVRGDLDRSRRSVVWLDQCLSSDVDLFCSRISPESFVMMIVRTSISAFLGDVWDKNYNFQKMYVPPRVREEEKIISLSPLHSTIGRKRDQR